MGLGIVDDHNLSHVPGTVLLDEQAGHTEDQTSNLKHGSGKDAHIILAPQPSEDPNDPLNWPQMRKDLSLTILCFGAIINAATQVCIIFDKLSNFRVLFSLLVPSPLPSTSTPLSQLSLNSPVIISSSSEPPGNTPFSNSF
jgi:hypothetical protein